MENSVGYSCKPESKMRKNCFSRCETFHILILNCHFCIFKLKTACSLDCQLRIFMTMDRRFYVYLRAGADLLFFEYCYIF